MNRKLVIYFSTTGVTAKVVNRLADAAVAYHASISGKNLSHEELERLMPWHPAVGNRKHIRNK